MVVVEGAVAGAEPTAGTTSDSLPGGCVRVVVGVGIGADEV